jgi:hypothetical protein
MAAFSTPLPLMLPGLSFQLGAKVQSDVWNRMHKPISWSDLGPDSFALVVSFGRCKFRLCPTLESLIL